MDEYDKLQIQQFVDQVNSEDTSHSKIVDSMKITKKVIGKQPDVYQNVVIKHSVNVLNTCQNIISNYINEHRDAVNIEELINVFQFLHNLCVGQKEFSKEMWLRLETSIFELLNSDKHSKLTNVLSAIVLQMLKHNCVRLKNTDAMAVILNSMLAALVTDDSAHFPLIVIQELIQNQPDFSLNLTYQHLKLQHKLLLLDIIAEQNLKELPAQVVEFLAACFKEQASILMTVMNQKSTTNPSETIRVLKLIGTYSHSNEFIHTLQADKSLLIDAVYLLRMVHESGKSNPDHIFGTVKSITEVGNTEKMESDPVFGFKRDLIRLIGNLCHEKRENQDQVREINGIELILDCSPIDGKNPYISQWVIFAIRNICLGNQENQAVLNSVSKTGTTDKQMLEEIGVQIQGM